MKAVRAILNVPCTDTGISASSPTTGKTNISARHSLNSLVTNDVLHVVLQKEIGGVSPTRDRKKRYKVGTSFLLSFGTLMRTKTDA